ncbi:hypothetical protein AX14_002310, partial [Amanita brunnescens Koide BX004]
MASEEVFKARDSFNDAISQDEHIPPEEEYRRILRKVDIRLLPCVSMLYLLSFLDRSNIGNAKIAGMVRDAHLTGLKYNIVCIGYFIPYALAEVPSNILLKFIRPSRWIPSIMVAWGIVMTLMCLCKTFEGLLVARVFLGLAEAGLFPGIVFYLSQWYRRRDVALRIAIFYSSATIAGRSFGIEHMENVGGLHGWQWIFCLEGLTTIVIATLSYFLMYDHPDTATFLTPNEQQFLIQILKEDAQDLATHCEIKFVWQALLDYKSYTFALISMCLAVPVYVIMLFLPTIINSLGYSSANAQLMTAPPFIVACLITILVGHLSDKFNLRGPFIIGGCIVSLVGYIILVTETSPAIGYVGAIMATIGIFPTVAINMAWVGSAAGGELRKGVTFAMVNGLANLGGICSSFIYLKPPRFFVGHGTAIGFLTLAIFLTMFSMWNLRRLNMAKEAQCAAEGLDDSRKGEFVEFGSESPLFR